MTDIGEKIRIQRLTKKYNQEYMAFMLNISQAAYSKIERGETEITLKKVLDIAEILEISHYTLIPKPKYGSGINLHFINRTLNKLKRFWTSDLKKRKALAQTQMAVYHSDITNTANK